METPSTQARSRPGGRLPALATPNDTVMGACVFLSLAVVFLPTVDKLKWALGILVVVGIATAWPRLSGQVRACALGSLAAGAAAVVATGATADDMADGLTQMASVFAFFVFVRLLEVPVVTGRFNHALARFLSERARIRSRAAAGTIVTYGLTSGLSIGAVPIAYRYAEALWDDVDHGDTRGMGRVVMQAFTAANAWTPVSPIVAVALETTAAPLPDVLVWALPASLVAAAGTVYLCRSSGSVRRAVTPPSSRGVGEFAVAILALVVSIAAIDRVWHVGPIGASMISIILAVTVWQWSLQGPRAGARGVWRALQDHRRSWPEQFTLFCAGGLLVGAAFAFSRGWDGAAGLAGLTPVLVLVVPVTIVLLAGLTLYPLVSLAAIGALLGPQVGAQASTALALALIVGASVAFLSPFTGVTLLVGSMSHRSSFEVGVRWNLAYALGYLAAGTALVAVVYGVG